MLREIARLFEPWKTLYENSVVLSTTVTTGHIVSLVVGGGFAIAADRTTLRTLSCPGPARPWLLEELRGVHRPVLIGIVVLAVTGVMLMVSDFETYATSVVFWVKMGLIAFLLINGTLLYRAEAGLSQAADAGTEPPANLCRWLRRNTWLSIALWLATTIIGMILTVSG